jgi:hypothetical protein
VVGSVQYMLLRYDLCNESVQYLFDSVPAVQLPERESAPPEAYNVLTRPPDAQARVLVQIPAVRYSASST